MGVFDNIRKGIGSIFGGSSKPGAPMTAVEADEAGIDAGEISLMGSSQYSPFFSRPYNPAVLYKKGGNYTLYDEMREDDQIYAVLTMKKMLMFGKGWEITAEPQDQEVKEYVEWCLRDYLDGGIDAALFEMLSALDFGFSLSEKVYGVVDYGKWTGRVGFCALKTRPPHGLLIHTDDHGNIVKFQQNQPKKGYVDLPTEKFLHYIHNEEFDNPYGRSDLNRGVYRAWWSKNQIISYWNMYLEGRATPMLHGKYPSSFTKADQIALLDVLKRAQARTALITPQGTEVDVIHGESGTSQQGFEQAIDRYDLSMARAILVPDLIGISGSKTGGGSYSLGQEQFKMFYQSLSKSRIYTERLINRELVRELVELNFGDFAESTVKFRLKELSEEDKMKQADLWMAAVKQSIFEPNDNEVVHLRELTGFPEGPIRKPPPPVNPFADPNNPVPPFGGKPGAAPANKGLPPAGDKPNPATGSADAAQVPGQDVPPQKGVNPFEKK